MHSSFTPHVVHLLVETVDDSGSSRFIDDTEVTTRACVEGSSKLSERLTDDVDLVSIQHG
jgi:hypothetical protein